jgi:hypothetical protein
VTGVRFFKGSQNTGTHTGELWTSGGTLLATATFVNETASGWQQVNFASPVAITAGMGYVVSYQSSSGSIAYTSGGFNSSVDNPPLHGLASSASGGNGVYHYDTTAHTAIYPNLTNGQSPNYWVDVAFSATASAPKTLFSVSSTPASNQQNINGPGITAAGGVDLGLKFRSDVATNVIAVRFYKGSLDTGVHTGQLWSSTGTLLASVTFTNETASGWQQANFSSPVAIAANTTYIISYHTSAPYIAYTSGTFSSGIDAGTLHGLANGVDGGNGVFHYDVTPGTAVFPYMFNGQSPNYWVDVVVQ